jgi:hypothetical protein
MQLCPLCRYTKYHQRAAASAMWSSMRPIRGLEACPGFVLAAHVEIGPAPVASGGTQASAESLGLVRVILLP